MAQSHSVGELLPLFSPQHNGSGSSTKPSLSSTELGELLSPLLARLELARGIVTPPDRALWIREELLLAGFTREQFRAAELWIIRGEWKKNILELADFFVDPRRIEHLLDDGERIVRPSQIAQERRKAVEGYRAMVEQRKTQQERKEAGKTHIEELAELGKMLLEKSSELKTARDRIEQLEKQIDEITKGAKQ